jgi:hypothetical protein
LSIFFTAILVVLLEHVSNQDFAEIVSGGMKIAYSGAVAKK